MLVYRVRVSIILKRACVKRTYVRIVSSTGGVNSWFCFSTYFPSESFGVRASGRFDWSWDLRLRQ